MIIIVILTGLCNLHTKDMPFRQTQLHLFVIPTITNVLFYVLNYDIDITQVLFMANYMKDFVFKLVYCVRCSLDRLCDFAIE